MDRGIRLFVGWLVEALARYGRMPVRVFLRLLPRQTEVVLNVQGHRMAAHSPDRIASLFLWKLGWLEREEGILIRNELKLGMAAVDIGANIGFHTLLFAQLVGPTGRVFAFEPDPDNFELLKRNLSFNGYGNVECLEKAVSNKTGTVSLFFSKEHRGDHRVFDSKDGRASFQVDAVRLDDVFPAPTKIDFIKMDIQGAERLALEGMRSILKRNEKIKVLCEFSPDLLILCGCKPEQFLEFWIANGFKTYILKEDGTLRSESDVQRIIGMCRSGHINLFLSRS